MENATILGISLGTRQCGLALLRNGTLVDWKVKNFSGAWTENKFNRIIGSIEKVIQKNGVQYIACKMPMHLRTLRLDSLLSGIKDFAFQKNISLCVTTIAELKEIEINILNRSAYAEYIAITYPELFPMLKRHRKVKTEYYLRIFEAVGAANYCSKQRKLHM